MQYTSIYRLIVTDGIFCTYFLSFAVRGEMGSTTEGVFTPFLFDSTPPTIT